VILVSPGKINSEIKILENFCCLHDLEYCPVTVYPKKEPVRTSVLPQKLLGSSSDFIDTQF
jgi:hypothetical protein